MTTTTTTNQHSGVPSQSERIDFKTNIFLFAKCIHLIMLWQLSRIYSILRDTKKHADSIADDAVIFNDSFKRQCFLLTKLDVTMGSQKSNDKPVECLFLLMKLLFGYKQAVKIPNVMELVKAMIMICFDNRLHVYLSFLWL